MMQNPVDAVFSTDELFEAILVHVDNRTLLVSALRVSRRWHDVVVQSIALQRALFLRPDGPPAPERGFVPPKVQNPLLKGLFPAWFENTKDFRPPSDGRRSSLYNLPTTIMSGYLRFKELPLYKASMDLEDNPFLRPSASWRRMLTCQPACYRLACSVAGPAPEGSPFGEVTVSTHENGMRMGELYDIILHHLMHHRDSGFMILWPEGADEGHARIAQQLERIIPTMSDRMERNLLEVWKKKPDLVVQMVWTRRVGGQSFSFERSSATLQEFWARCGSDAQSLAESLDKCGLKAD